MLFVTALTCPALVPLAGRRCSFSELNLRGQRKCVRLGFNWFADKEFLNPVSFLSAGVRPLCTSSRENVPGPSLCSRSPCSGEGGGSGGGGAGWPATLLPWEAPLVERAPRVWFQVRSPIDRAPAALCVRRSWSEPLGHSLSSDSVSFTKWHCCLPGGGPRPANPSVISAVRLSHQRRRRPLPGPR